MPGISIGVSGAALRAFGKERRAQRAVTRAVRKASHTSARDMRSEAVKVVRESKRIKVKAIRKAVVIHKNKGRRLEDMEWGVDIRGDLVRLSDYPVRQTKKGVSAEINRGNRKLHRGAFIAMVGSGNKKHKGVFKRDGDDRLPISERLATRPLGVLREKRAARAVTRRGRKSFQKTFKRWMKVEMGKAKR